MRGAIQACASISAFDLDVFRTVPFSESRKAHGVLMVEAKRDPVAVVDAKNWLARVSTLARLTAASSASG